MPSSSRTTAAVFCAALLAGTVSAAGSCDGKPPGFYCDAGSSNQTGFFTCPGGASQFCSPGTMCKQPNASVISCQYRKFCKGDTPAGKYCVNGTLKSNEYYDCPESMYPAKVTTECGKGDVCSSDGDAAIKCVIGDTCFNKESGSYCSYSNPANYFTCPQEGTPVKNFQTCPGTLVCSAGPHGQWGPTIQCNYPSFVKGAATIRLN